MNLRFSLTIVAKINADVVEDCISNYTADIVDGVDGGYDAILPKKDTSRERDSKCKYMERT